MSGAIYIRLRGYQRWCRYRSAVANDRITTVCRASIAQGEPLELADHVVDVDRCAACEATLDVSRALVDAQRGLAERRVSLDTSALTWRRPCATPQLEDDDELGSDSDAPSDHEDLLGDDLGGAFDHLREVEP